MSKALPPKPEYFEGNAEASFLHRERARLIETRPLTRVGQPWNGVSLSGGGIRSATFCLGAMQALAEKNLLGAFDYMSSVSGGGYTASALQWWWHQSAVPELGGARFDASKENFPFGTDLSGRPENATIHSRILEFLRQHGKYLAPGDGLTMWSAISVVLRTLFLNLAVWLPLAALVFGILIAAGQLSVNFMPNVVKGVPNLLSWLIKDDWTGAPPSCGHALCRLPFTLAFGILVIIFAVISAFFATFSMLLAFLSFASRPDWIGYGQRLRRWTALAIFSFAAICLIALYWLWPSRGFWMSWDPFTIAFASVALAGIMISTFLLATTKNDSNYYWRRKFETMSGASLIYALIILAIGSVPLAPYYLLNYGSGVSSALSALMGATGGLVSASYGHSSQSRRQTSSKSGSAVASVGSAIFIYFILVSAYFMAQLVFNLPAIFSLPAVTDRWIQGLMLFFVMLALFMGWLTNINHVGLHRFYRDRIMEAFMPSLETVRDLDQHTHPATEADNLQISELIPSDGSGQFRNTPYPLINTNIVLVNDDKPKFALRGGDNFVLSPLFIGSAATGWQDTKSYIAQNGSLTLASAMAASGAALNANAAYAGTGTTRDRLLSIVMMLLNLRLGLWSAVPSKTSQTYRLFTPDYFHPALTFGLLRRGYKRTSGFVELTDGGHFDNIGLYELVRRRCAVIVVVDAEADPTTSMPALVSVVQRIEQDFGAKIDLIPAEVNCIVPKLGSGFPVEAKYVTAPFFTTKIQYSKQEESTPRQQPDEASQSLRQQTGTLVYVKAGLIEELDFSAKGYWAQNPAFPHEATSDQFFDATQFEAYRQLGYRSMLKAIEGSQLSKLTTSTQNDDSSLIAKVE